MCGIGDVEGDAEIWVQAAINAIVDTLPIEYRGSDPVSIDDGSTSFA